MEKITFKGVIVFLKYAIFIFLLFWSYPTPKLTFEKEVYVYTLVFSFFLWAVGLSSYFEEIVGFWFQLFAYALFFIDWGFNYFITKTFNLAFFLPAICLVTAFIFSFPVAVFVSNRMKSE
jgi:hypothetical protein